MENYETRFLIFEKDEGNSSDGDEVWEIRSRKDGSLLAKAYWYSEWKKYIWEPEVNTIFDGICTKDISDFMAKLTA